MNHLFELPLGIDEVCNFLERIMKGRRCEELKGCCDMKAAVKERQPVGLCPKTPGFSEA